MFSRLYLGDELGEQFLPLELLLLQLLYALEDLGPGHVGIRPQGSSATLISSSAPLR